MGVAASADGVSHRQNTAGYCKNPRVFRFDLHRYFPLLRNNAGIGPSAQFFCCPLVQTNGDASGHRAPVRSRRFDGMPRGTVMGHFEKLVSVSAVAPKRG
jgi:hypothetical protein